MRLATRSDFKPIFLVAEGAVELSSPRECTEFWSELDRESRAWRSSLDRCLISFPDHAAVSLLTLLLAGYAFLVGREL
jgi:hypothetical protein